MTTQDDTTGMPENPYADEARQRWGHTDAYTQSQERVKTLTKADWERIKQAGDDLMKEIAAVAESGMDPASPEAQALFARHYDALRTFYEPSPELYRGLADLYVADERFGAYYDAYCPGLAAYMRDGMHAYCDALGKK